MTLNRAGIRFMAVSNWSLQTSTSIYRAPGDRAPGRNSGYPCATILCALDATRLADTALRLAILSQSVSDGRCRRRARFNTRHYDAKRALKDHAGDTRRIGPNSTLVGKDGNTGDSSVHVVTLIDGPNVTEPAFESLRLVCG